MAEKVSSSGELRYFERKLSPKLKQVRLVPLSDFHKGNPLCSDKHILRQRDFIRDSDNVVTVLNGDLCEAVTKQSKGEIYHQLLTPQEQRDWVIELLMPIKDKILGVTRGNHETRIWNETGIDICEDIAKALGAPYRAEGILLKIVFGGNNSRHPNKPYSYFIYMTHGYGGARTKSAKAVKVERLATWIHADCYLMCLSEDTEVLTQGGWCNYKELVGNEFVLTLNKSTGYLEYQQIRQLHTSPYDGGLIHLVNRNIDILATPNHRIIYSYADGYLEKELSEFAKLNGQVAIPRCGYLSKYPGVTFSDDYIRLMAWVITEGHFRIPPYGSGIDIRQSSSSHYIKEIEDLLIRLNIKYGRYEVKTKGQPFNANGKTYFYNGNAVTFHIYAKDGNIIRKTINEKRIPGCLHSMDDRQFNIFLEELLKGDGYIGKVTNYITKDSVLAGQLQALCFQHGVKVTINQSYGKRAYTLVLSNKAHIGIRPNRLYRFEQYKGRVWCLSVANGNFVVRRNGRAYITGNSHDHVVNVAPDIYLFPDNRTTLDQETGFTTGKIKAHRKMLVKTGAFLKWGSYAESGGFPPVDLSQPIIKFAGTGKPRVTVEV